jgi:tRNA pseudouridine38-40 synthase
MPRFRLLVEYDGTPFVGWQRQPVGTSVQGVLEQALQRLCGMPVAVQAAGRTDAGVHARGQVVHADLPRDFPADTVRDAVNFHVRPHPVAVLMAEPVDDGFHARFSATGRAYVYRILNRRAPAVLERSRMWWVPVPLDDAAMAAAARHLLGRHDFTSFRAAACQANSPVKTLDVLDVRRDGESIAIHAAARSFLHHQVRNMVGTLKLVGEGKWPPEAVGAALAARSRAAAGPTAPPEGLYLTEVRY